MSTHLLRAPWRGCVFRALASSKVSFEASPRTTFRSCPAKSFARRRAKFQYRAVLCFVVFALNDWHWLVDWSMDWPIDWSMDQCTLRASVILFLTTVFYFACICLVSFCVHVLWTLNFNKILQTHCEYCNALPGDMDFWSQVPLGENNPFVICRKTLWRFAFSSRQLVQKDNTHLLVQLCTKLNASCLEVSGYLPRQERIYEKPAALSCASPGLSSVMLKDPGVFLSEAVYGGWKLVGFFWTFFLPQTR